MARHKVGEGIELDLETQMLYIEGMEPFKVKMLEGAEQEGLEEWHNILEKGKNKV